ncbi:Integrin beta-PS-like 3 [Homarus americanus]|uniref:Integrin beta n=1 Tax=Homarus americanus TaxID=6706 RepID=A0A8J5MQK0_HOMAM|nr:Integrin beta-PS-like 3 [Homarus americanus]
MMVVVVVVMAAAQERVDSCHSKRNCKDCIQTPDCMWCTNPKMVPTKIEHQIFCRHISTNVTEFCDEENLENPTNFMNIVVQNQLTETGKRTTAEDEENIIQITPQRIKLKLRKGTPINVTLTYRQARDYPIDLYYLMDLSNSMNDDKQKLGELGDELATLLSQLTKQYQLGFGSFVDKVMMPYADTAPNKIDKPCHGCAPPFSFRNDLPLDKNPKLFTRKVKEVPMSGNLDAPEGGFDALMQAMLAGIVQPNDEKCHLNNKNEYDQYDKYDYPSIAQINKVSKEHNINVIFAVSNYVNLYRELSSLIETSSYGKLDNNSANVVRLVDEQYKKISSVLRLTDNSTNSPVSIRYFSSCKGGDSPVNTKMCKQIREGDTVSFTLEVTANECREDETKSIVEVKTLEDNLILEIEYECSCSCEAQAVKQNDPKCNSNGVLICGVCSCNQGYRGDNCQCSISDTSASSEEDKKLCRAKVDERECSSRGFCSCGTCVCTDSVETCSGHGDCDCNSCKCRQGYTGGLCECKDDSACKEPGSQMVCSGHGECACGKCKCTPDGDTTYTGQYCEECLTCPSGKCFSFKDCVQCIQFGTGALSKEACTKCNVTTTVTQSLNGQVELGARLCTFEDEEGCYFNFTYRYIGARRDDELKYDIYVQEDRQCPEAAPVMGIIFGLVAAIVALGILTLLIWKLLTSFHDRQEKKTRYTRVQKLPSRTRPTTANKRSF